MYSSTLQETARECSTVQLVGLLKEYGATEFTCGSQGLYYIKIGAEASRPKETRAAKMSVVADYIAKQGAFAANDGSVPPAAAEQIQDALIALFDAVNGLKEELESQTRDLHALTERFEAVAGKMEKRQPTAEAPAFKDSAPKNSIGPTPYKGLK